MTELVVGVGLVAVGGLTGVLLAGRSARRRARAAAVEAVPHPHYWAECDQEWPHVGRSCLQSWALSCSKCVGAPAGADIPARSPA